MLLFLFHGTEFRVIFSSAEGFGTEFRDVLFRGTTGIPSEITICSVYSVFRGIIFFSEIPNPSPESHHQQVMYNPHPPACTCTLYTVQVNHTVHPLQDTKQLQRYLEMVNIYHRFTPVLLLSWSPVLWMRIRSDPKTFYRIRIRKKSFRIQAARGPK